MSIQIFSEVLGRKVEVPEHPSRIVSLAPAITDALYSIGAGERVVGVSVFCNKPPEARDKPRVGSYFKVNYRKLEELKPDLVLVTTGAQRERIYELQEKGYTVYPLPLPTDMYMLISNIITLGHIVGEKENAYRLANKLASMLHDIKSEHIIGRVYFEIDLGGPTSAGSITYIDHALKIIGLENILGDLRTTWIVNPEPETIIKKDPDLIIYEKKPFDDSDESKIVERLTNRGLGELKAVKMRRIIVLEPDTLAHYGPALIPSLRDIKYRVIEMLGTSGTLKT